VEKITASAASQTSAALVTASHDSLLLNHLQKTDNEGYLKIKKEKDVTYFKILPWI
jgi:hypothetical protein